MKYKKIEKWKTLKKIEKLDLTNFYVKKNNT